MELSRFDGLHANTDEEEQRLLEVVQEIQHLPAFQQAIQFQQKMTAGIASGMLVLLVYIVIGIFQNRKMDSETLNKQAVYLLDNLLVVELVRQAFFLGYLFAKSEGVADPYQKWLKDG